jgi:hypothetical protein
MRWVPGEKPRTFTFDAEVVVAADCTGHVETTTAVLTHYVAPTDDPFVEGALYFVSGRVGSVDDSFPVGDGFAVDMYDFVIDGETVCVLLRF